MGHNEELIGRFLKQNPGVRDKLFIGSKCGWKVSRVFAVSAAEPQVDFENKTNDGVTNSREHIKTFIEGSIKRLGTIPDLYYLHRRDPNTPLEESITALNEIKKEGKCRFIGLSEPSAKTLREACKSKSTPPPQRARFHADTQSLTLTRFKSSIRRGSSTTSGTTSSPPRTNWT